MALADQQLHRIVGWLLGGLSGRGWDTVSAAAPPMLAGAVALCLLGRPLDALCGGEEAARALGLWVGGATVLVLAAASLSVATAVAAGGVIGFVGLAGPHLARPRVGVTHARLVPASGLVGALLLLGADATGPVRRGAARTAHRRGDGPARRPVLPGRAASLLDDALAGWVMVLASTNLDCGYRRAVLTGVSLTVRAGELFVILGPNGSGKTTLLRTLARLVRPLNGAVTLDGKDVWSCPPSHVARAVAFTSQVLAPDWPASRSANSSPWGAPPIAAGGGRWGRATAGPSTAPSTNSGCAPSSIGP